MKAGKLVTVLFLTLVSNLATASDFVYLCTELRKKPGKPIKMKIAIDPGVIVTTTSTDGETPMHWAYVEEDLELKMDRYRSVHSDTEHMENLFIPKKLKNSFRMIIRTRTHGDFLFICNIQKE